MISSTDITHFRNHHNLTLIDFGSICFSIWQLLVWLDSVRDHIPWEKPITWALYRWWHWILQLGVRDHCGSGISTHISNMPMPSIEVPQECEKNCCQKAVLNVRDCFLVQCDIERYLEVDCSHKWYLYVQGSTKKHWHRTSTKTFNRAWCFQDGFGLAYLMPNLSL